MDRIDHLEEQLAGLADAPLVERADAWREVYRDCPDFARYRMHRLAYSDGLGAATGGEWIHDEDISEPGESSYPYVGIRATRHYRGFSLDIVDQAESASTWEARVTVRDSLFHKIHECHCAHLPSVDEAFRTCMRTAMQHVDLLMDKQPPPKGADPGQYILGEESD